MKKPHKIFIILIPIIFIFCIWQNNDLVLTEYTYSSDKISEEMDDYKIIQISDLHNKRFGKEQDRLLKAVSGENPDIIVVTGDLVDSNHTNLDIAMEFMEGAVRIAPVYYVTGNHENWLSDADMQMLNEELEENGITVLNNEIKEISCGKSSFLLAGLADENLRDSTLHRLVSDVEDELVILLAHEPQYLEKYSNERVDLVLTGHAHGGQIRLPFIGGLVAPDQGLFPKYTAGEHQIADTTMIINRGLGNSIIPVRIFNRPEIVSVRLRKK